jgi:hypothetical protein
MDKPPNPGGGSVHFAVPDLLWGDEAPVLVSRCCLGFGTNTLKLFYDDHAGIRFFPRHEPRSLPVGLRWDFT